MPIRPTLRACAALCALAAASTVSLPAMAQADTRPLFINSSCKYPVRLLVHHKDSRHEHHPHGWYTFEAYEENRLQANDVTLRQVVGEDLFIFAETVQRSGVPGLTWGGNDSTTVFQGVQFSLRKANLFVNQKGDLEVKLTCSEAR